MSILGEKIRMNDIEVAKNLLLDRSCDNCVNRRRNSKMNKNDKNKFCWSTGNKYELKETPKNNTCKYWKRY